MHLVRAIYLDLLSKALQEYEHLREEQRVLQRKLHTVKVKLAKSRRDIAKYKKGIDNDPG